MKPKWQRARLLDCAPFSWGPGLMVGDRVWVASGAPDTKHDRSGEQAYRLKGHCLCGLPGCIRSNVAQRFVELIPEFSFADDPDAEVRQ